MIIIFEVSAWSLKETIALRKDFDEVRFSFASLRALRFGLDTHGRTRASSVHVHVCVIRTHTWLCFALELRSPFSLSLSLSLP